MAQGADPILLEAQKPLGGLETVKPVAERLPNEFEPVPIQWRGFEITPLLISSQIIDTNIYAASTNEETDTITSLAPSVFVNKDVGRHEFNASVGADMKKYWSNTDEDVFNFNTKFGGTLEARHDITLPFELTYNSGHEKRGQNFSANFSKKPIAFDSFGAAFGITYNPNRLSLSLVGRHGGIEFENGTNRAGQTVVREDGDRTFNDIEIGASYDILPNHTPFISFNLGNIKYDRRSFQGGGFNGPKRDSNNMGVLAGWKLAYKGIIEGTIALGYGERNYDDNALEDIKTSRVATNINWNVTKKATLNLGLERSIKEDNQLLQGLVLTQGRLGLDYEFLHNLFYNAYLNYSYLDFQAGNREDDVFSAGTGLRYMISPRFSVSGDYDFISRDSSALGLDYDRHQFMVRLHTRF
ncbi:MAG TPA: outer membrane beta-barrel protein [Alphaproteobacteria bacterium]|nr:outer membrane beta-barrel protein [Alphaproteobacteria bacterium]